MASNQDHPQNPRRDPNAFFTLPAIPTSQGPTMLTNSPSQITHFGNGAVVSKTKIISVLFQTSMPKEQDAIVTALKTRHVPQAVYDAQLEKGCMEGTRVQILKDIEAWITDPKAPQIFWLTGMAGTGKTAIAWTICFRVSEHPDMVLGGSFFCSRSTGSMAQRDIRCIVPTLAQLLARQSTKFSEVLAYELARDPDILHKQVWAQIERLIKKPLLALKESPLPIVFVIDALDECEGQPISDGTPDDAECHRIVSEVLEALVEFSRSSDKLPVKFLVTSRPEPHIRETSLSNDELNRILRLHTVDKEQVDADIRLYICKRLSISPRHELTNEINVDMLVRLCNGLFIVAATALNYALSGGLDRAPIRLQSLLNSSQDNLGDMAVVPLDGMYAVILAGAAKVDEPGTDELREVLRLLAALLTAQMTLSITALADILGREKKHVRANLALLHAVVHVPDRDDEGGLRTLHASFGDYLFSRAQNNLRVSKSLGDETLAHGCLSIMRDKLHFNVSKSRSSYMRNSSTRPSNITLSLEYACLHWVYHVSSLPEPSNLYGEIHNVFCSRVLFWLEVMSVLGRVWRAAAMLFFAASTVRHVELSQFLRDAHAFVASSREAIERSAPHIYLSALPFAAKRSRIWTTFSPHCTGLISVKTSGIDRHGGRLAITLTGHEDAVNSVTYSHDGHLLASGSEDGTVRIWDTRIGEEAMSPPRGGDGPVLSVAFSPHDKMLVSGMYSGAVCVWSPSFGQMAVSRLSGHSAAVSCIVFAPDGSLFASASRDMTVRIWYVEKGESSALLTGHAGEVTAVAFSHDGDILSSCSSDCTIRLWNVRTSEPVGEPLRGHTAWIVGVSFSSAGTILASASQDCTIQLWDFRAREKIATLRGHSDWICSIQFSPDGRSLVSAAQDHTVRLWTLQQNATETSSIVLEGHTRPVRSVTFSRDGMYIASGSDDNTIRIWDAGMGQAAAKPLPAHDGPVRSVAVSTNGHFIVSGSDDGTVRIWNKWTGELSPPLLKGHTDVVSSVTISSDGLLIASGSKDRTIRLWDVRKVEAVSYFLRGHVGWVNDVKFSTDALWLASASDDKTVRIWNIATRQLSATSQLLCSAPAQTVAFSPDGRLISSGDSRGYIHLWVAATGQPLRQLVRAAAQPVTSIAFSRAGARIVTSWSDNVGRVWNVDSGRPVVDLKGHTAPICSVAYSGDDRFIVSGSEDHTVRLWNAAAGDLVYVFLGHTGSVRSVASATDGCAVASCSDDRMIRIWDIKAALSLPDKYIGDVDVALVSERLEEGWLLGPSKELRLWVPAEYRQYLQLPPYTTVIGPYRVVVTACSITAHHGENWSLCWSNSPAAGAASRTL